MRFGTVLVLKEAWMTCPMYKVFIEMQLSKKYIQIYRYVFVNCKIISKIQIKESSNLCFNSVNHRLIYCTIDHIV